VQLPPSCALRIGRTADRTCALHRVDLDADTMAELQQQPAADEAASVPASLHLAAAVAATVRPPVPMPHFVPGTDGVPASGDMPKTAEEPEGTSCSTPRERALLCIVPLACASTSVRRCVDAHALIGGWAQCTT
jgi:hypothetical protein